jgi:hypothetical protein
MAAGVQAANRVVGEDVRPGDEAALLVSALKAVEQLVKDRSWTAVIAAVTRVGAGQLRVELQKRPQWFGIDLGRAVPMPKVLDHAGDGVFTIR